MEFLLHINHINYFILKIVQIYQIIMIIYFFVILVKVNNKYTRWIIEILSKICEPTLSIVRRIIPTIMNFDFSPLIIIFILEIFKQIITY